MRILMVTANFPPQLNPECIVNGKLARSLADAGVELTVVTQASNPARHTKDESRYWKNDPGRIIRLSPPWYAYTERLGNIPAKIRLRERSTSWFGAAAYSFCRNLLRENNYDLVLSRSNPVDAMAAVYNLRKDFRFKWFAGLNDPFPPCLYPEPYSKGRPDGIIDKMQARWTARALAAADAVIFPCERLARHVAASLGIEFADRLLVIPHIAWRESSAGKNERGADIVHIGSLGKPRMALDFIRHFHDAMKVSLDKSIRLVFIGKTHEDFRNFISENNMESRVVLQDPVSYEESLRRIDSSSSLLLMEARFREGVFLPSKFCDYAASGRPLLLFSPDKGAISDLVRGYDHPGFMGQKETSYKERIEKFLDALSSGADLSGYAYPEPGMFSPEKIAAMILERI